MSLKVVFSVTTPTAASVLPSLLTSTTAVGLKVAFSVGCACLIARASCAEATRAELAASMASTAFALLDALFHQASYDRQELIDELDIIGNNRNGHSKL